LNGTFEWQLAFAFGAEANPDLPSLFGAVQELLGLKLDARTRSVPCSDPAPLRR
jgi:hypothetical protein